MFIQNRMLGETNIFYFRGFFVIVFYFTIMFKLIYCFMTLFTPEEKKGCRNFKAKLHRRLYYKQYMVQRSQQIN